MHRRSFLVHCGLAAAGTVFLPVLVPSAAGLQAADLLSAQSSAQLTGSDRQLLRLLSAYGSDVYFWGGQVFTRATGIGQKDGTTHLLVRVADYSQLMAFLHSDAEKTLGTVRATSNTLNFTYQGTAYTVTNEGAEGFTKAISGGGVSRQHLSDGDVALFAHESVLYHPSTDTLSDPNLLLKKHSIDLAETPTGGLRAQFQTLVHGWLESRSTGLKLGKKFTTFQDELLASVPTDKAAEKVAKSLLANISLLAASFDVDALRPLLTSPLVSASLKAALGLDAETVLADVAKLRGELASGDYTDAALWLAGLLGPQIKDGTLGEWLDLMTGDAATTGATKAALPGARRLLGQMASGVR